MFNWVVGIPLLALFGSTALAISILPSSRQESSRVTLKILLVLMSVWTFSSLMLHSTANPSTPFWLCLIIALGGFLFAVGVHFCAEFTESRGSLIKSLVGLSYLIAFAILIGVVTGNMVTSAVLLPNGTVDIEFGRIIPVMWGTIPLIMLISLGILISSFIRSPDTRGRYTVLPLAGFFIMLIGVLSNIFVSRYPVDVATGFVFISLLSYSVLGSHILKPSVYEKWWLSGPGVLLLLAIGYIGVFTYSLEWLELNYGLSHISATIVIALLFLFTFEPLRSLFAGRFIEYVFPFSNRYYESIANLRTVDQSLSQWESAITTILNTIAKATRAKEATLFVRNDETQHFEALYISNNQNSGISPLRLPMNSPLITALKDRGGSLTVEDIEGQIYGNDISNLFINGLFCGLVGYDGLVGIILVTGEFPGKWKRSEDRDFLELVCQQTVPIVENSLLYQSSQRELAERKRIQNSLEESEEKYRVLVENASDYIFMIDKDFIVISANKSAGTFLGSTPGAIIGKSIFDLFTPEVSKQYSQTIQQVFDTGVPLTEDTISNIGEQKTILNTIISPIKDNEGRVCAIIGVSRDISERIRSEERETKLRQELIFANRLSSVGEMAAGIAHEINNPLTGVIGFAELLMKKDLPEDIRKNIEMISEGGNRAAGVLSRMLTFARQTKPMKEEININEVIKTTLEMRSTSLEVNNIDVVTELYAELPAIIADGGQLQQVFLNIILNAETEMKNAHGKGNLIIKTEKVNDTIRISFADDGLGIPEENLEKIFDPFFTTREVGQGTGLGLSICHGIIAEHQGSIHAESELGNGTTFVIELPIVTQDGQLGFTKPDVESTAAVKPAKILIVDDDPIVQKYLATVLTDEGHEVEVIDNGNDVIERLCSQSYEVIFLDIRLTGKSGIDIYRELEKKSNSITKNIIFITGDVTNPNIVDFLSSINAPHISKPFNVEQLKKDMDRILKQQS